MFLRRLFCAAALTALSVLLCPAPGSAQEKKLIGLAVANLQADFFNQIKQSVDAEAKVKGVDLIVADAKGDAATQVDQIQDLITRGVKAIIYIPAGATAAGVPAKAAKKANIPVVNVDRNAPDVPGDTFIATDSVGAAKTLGEYVCKVTGGKANIAIIQGQLGTTPEMDRDKGFSEALANCPGIKVVAKQPTKAWMQDEGFAIAQDMLQRFPNINAFFGRADALALGAAHAVKVANVGSKVWIFGFDGDVAGLKAVRDGTLDATMTQKTQYMGKLALDSALDLIDGKQLPKEQLQEAVLTTKENVGPFIDKHP
jgi:ribose transport system substrate-binding protein